MGRRTNRSSTKDCKCFSFQCSLLFFFVGGCFAFLGLMILWRNHIFQKQGIRIHGRVVDVIQEGKENYLRSFPVIEYQFQGQKRRFKDLLEISQDAFKINDHIPIYVFQAHLESAMSLRFIEKIKGTGYLLSTIGIVSCIVGLLVGSVYFENGLNVDISFDDSAVYGELFFAVMLGIAVIRTIFMLSDAFAHALRRTPLEKNAYLVNDD